MELYSELYTNSNIDFCTHTKLRPVNRDNEGKIYPLVFISDFDDVWIDGSVGEYTLASMVNQNPYMRPMLKTIGAQIADTQKTHDTEKLRVTIEEQFKKFDVTKSCLENAYKSGYDVAKKKWKNGAEEFLYGIVDRGFTLGFISGSFTEPLQMLLSDLGVNKKFVYGSHVEYDTENKVSNVKLNLDESKLSSKIEILKKLTSSSSCLHVVTSDQAVDKKMGEQSQFYAGINPFLMVGKEFSEVSRLTVYCPEAARNLKNLLKPIDKWCSAIVNGLIESPNDTLEILNALEKIKSDTSIASKYKTSSSLLKRRRTIPVNESGLLRLSLDIENFRNPIIKNIYMSEFIGKLLSYFPELHADENFKEGIKKLAENS